MDIGGFKKISTFYLYALQKRVTEFLYASGCKKNLIINTQYWVFLNSKQCLYCRYNYLILNLLKKYNLDSFWYVFQVIIFILLGSCSCEENKNNQIGNPSFTLDQRQGYALIIGVEMTEVELNGKVYDQEATAGSDKNIERMESILKKSGFNMEDNVRVLDNLPSSAEILNALQEQVSRLEHDDLFIFYFFGHGDQIKDTSNDENETYPNDEVLIAYDSIILDDEINTILKNIQVTARVLMIVDACHSGTSFSIEGNEIYTPMNDLFMDELYSEGGLGNIDFLYLGAATDETETYGNRYGSYFNTSLYDAWNDGYFDESHEEFYKRIKKRLRQKTKKTTPVFIDSLATERFINHIPFKIKYDEN